MADIDHRRKQKSDDNSEKSFSDSEIENDDLNATPNSSKETSDKIAVMKSGDCSEYESAEEVDKSADQCCKESSLSELVDEEGGEEGIAEQPEDVEAEFLNGENDASDEEDDYVQEERQQGDGEECSPIDAEKELDFDEDRRNPQYIPKKGMFYEHDDRNNEDIKEKQEEPPRDRKKKLWLDEGKWGHDRFREEEQFPKSRNELIEAYGYDIRNEDGPPRARRRRRYGRGPMKYDRNWEDVTAYGRERFKASSVRGPPRGSRRGRFRGPHPRYRGRQDFNEENSRRNEESAATPTLETLNEPPQEQSGEAKEEVLRHEDFPALPTKVAGEPPPPEQLAEAVRTITFENSNLSARNADTIPPRRGKTPPFSSVHDRGSRRPNTRGGRGGRSDYRGRGRGGSHQRHISPRFLENKINNNLSSELEQLSLLHDNICEEDETNREPTTNLNEEMQAKGEGRPKRYSSLRQRSLPETTSYPPPLPQAPYYETGYQTSPYALTEATPSTQSQTATMNPPAAYQTFTPPPYSDSYGLRLSVTPPPRLFPQVSVPQPILAAPPCITATPTIMNFAPPPPPPTGYPFTYQQFTTPPPPAPAPPSELYPAAGITYYYPPTQPPPVRHTLHKRAAKAIPILPPPPESSRKEKVSSEEVPTPVQLQSTVGVES